MTTITLNRGETLGVLCTPKTGGVAITLDSSYVVAAFILADVSGHTKIDLGATISDGKVSIVYDTVTLIKGNYVGDIRITNSTPTDQWTEKFKLVIKEPVTPPTIRP